MKFVGSEGRNSHGTEFAARHRLWHVFVSRRHPFVAIRFPHVALKMPGHLLRESRKVENTDGVD